MSSSRDAVVDPKKTSAGNYFVANYPPFSFWSPGQRDDVTHALQQPPATGTPLGLYLHLPFCRKRCHFCYFRVYTGKDAKPARVDRYVDLLLRELESYARRPLIAGRQPRFIYFGGGTPSFLPPATLRRLVEGMKAILPWDAAEEVTFECEPGTLDEEKLDTLRQLGITRLSLGIENFDDHVLKTNGRAHLSREIHRAYQYARKIGFNQINVDLIAGMLNETDANWQRCIDETVALAPECVTIYQMEIPFNTTIYREMRERGEVTAPVANWPTKRAWVHDAFRQLESAGYTVTSTCTAIRNPQDYHFLYRDYLWRGADMISLGIASFGHFRGVHYQNEKDFEPYAERLDAGELPIHRALAMTEEEKLIREVILQFKLGALDRQYFLEKFNTDILSRFADPLAQLEAAGDLRRTETGVELTRDALLRVDGLLHAFFLPQHQNARYT